MNNSVENVVTLSRRDIKALALISVFDTTVQAVVEFCELGFSSEPILMHVLGIQDSVDFTGGGRVLVGYENYSDAVSAIEKWHDEGCISSDDTLELWLRDADGNFKFKDQY